MAERFNGAVGTEIDELELELEDEVELELEELEGKDEDVELKLEVDKDEPKLELELEDVGTELGEEDEVELRLEALEDKDEDVELEVEEDASLLPPAQPAITTKYPISISPRNAASILRQSNIMYFLVMWPDQMGMTATRR